MPFKNHEEKLAYDRRYRAEHKDKIREHWNKWEENHPDYVYIPSEQEAEVIRNTKINWAKNNPDKVKKTREKYKSSHRELLREKDKEYYQRIISTEEGRNHLKELRLTRYHNNREKFLIRAKKYRENNIDKVRLRDEKYRKSHPEVKAFLQRNRKAKLEAAYGNGITKAQFDEMCAENGYRCSYCGKIDKLTMDHVIPISRGGSHDIYNIVPACHKCNSTKNNRDLVLFLYKRFANGI